MNSLSFSQLMCNLLNAPNNGSGHECTHEQLRISAFPYNVLYLNTYIVDIRVFEWHSMSILYLYVQSTIVHSTHSIRMHDRIISDACECVYCVMCSVCVSSLTLTTKNLHGCQWTHMVRNVERVIILFEQKQIRNHDIKQIENKHGKLYQRK